MLEAILAGLLLTCVIFIALAFLAMFANAVGDEGCMLFVIVFIIASIVMYIIPDKDTPVKKEINTEEQYVE